jgi:hypothetical protein
MVIQTLLGAEEERSKLANQSYTIYVFEKQEDPAADASAGFQVLTQCSPCRSLL